MKITRKQLSKLIREKISKHNTKSVDKILQEVINSMHTAVQQTYSDLDADSYSGTAGGGITMGWYDPAFAVSYDEADENLDEDEEVIDEDEDEVDEGEYE